MTRWQKIEQNNAYPMKQRIEKKFIQLSYFKKATLKNGGTKYIMQKEMLMLIMHK